MNKNKLPHEDGDINKDGAPRNAPDGKDAETTSTPNSASQNNAKPKSECTEELKKMAESLCQRLSDLDERITVSDVQELLDKGFDVNAKCWGDETLLHVAAKRNRKEIVKFLIEKNADLNSRTELGWTPLFYAVFGLCGLDSVKILLEANADANVVAINGVSLLERTVGRPDFLKVFSLLLEHGANPNRRNKDGLTMLMVALNADNFGAMHLLLEYGAKVDSRDEEGLTAFMRALWDGKFDVAKFLLNHGAYIDARLQNEMTPLIIAAVTGQKRIVEFLLENGANANARNRFGETAVKLALEAGRRDIADLILSYADPEHSNNNQKKG